MEERYKYHSPELQLGIRMASTDNETPRLECKPIAEERVSVSVSVSHMLVNYTLTTRVDIGHSSTHEEQRTRIMNVDGKGFTGEEAFCIPLAFARAAS